MSYHMYYIVLSYQMSTICIGNYRITVFMDISITMLSTDIYHISHFVIAGIACLQLIAVFIALLVCEDA